MGIHRPPRDPPVPAFLIAVVNAIGEISKEEALAAIEKHWARLRRGLEP